MICWRCGVEFDHKPFRYGAPCADCQLDISGDWRTPWRLRGKHVTDETNELKKQDIVRLYKRNMTDPEIAEELGISSSTVYDWRHKLNLAAHPRRGAAHWKNYDATLAKLRSDEHGARIREGKRK